MPIAAEGIINREFSDLLRSWIDGDRYVDIYIEQSDIGSNIPIDGRDAEAIRSHARYLDSITGLQFRETAAKDNADILFTQVNKEFVNEPGTLGYIEVAANDIRDYYNIVYLDNELGPKNSDTDDVTIWHEFGHALGLDHPYGDGYNRKFTVDDTIMSYNQGFGIIKSKTDSDIVALKLLWGEAGTGYDLTVGSPSVPATPATPATPAGANEALVSALISTSWIQPGEISADDEVTFCLDTKGKIKYSNRNARNGTSYGISNAEAGFVRDLMGEIDAAIAVSVVEVGSAIEADILIGSVKDKSGFLASNSSNQKGGYVEAIWADDKGSRLTSKEQGRIGYAVMGSFGFGNTPKSYTTRDSIMGWQDVGYYGITTSDIAALQQLWGAQA